MSHCPKGFGKTGNPDGKDPGKNRVYLEDMPGEI